MSLFSKAMSLLVETPHEPNPILSLHADDVTSDDIPLPSDARLSYEQDEPRGHVKTVADIARDADGPNLDQVQVDGAALPPTAADKPLDFPAIYRAAKLPESGFGAEQMLETLASLPAELPLETKRVTVRAMLGTLGKTTGATPESLVADASRKLAALHSFSAFMDKKTGEAVAQNEADIAQLQAQIEDKRTAILNAKTELARVHSSCETEAHRLDDVLEFFSLDQGASKYAPEVQSA